MNEQLRTFLDAKLNSPSSRRRFVGGDAGLAAVSALGPHVDAQEKKLGGEFYFLGWDGENGRNVAPAAR
ncbi:MAG: hypothetical protein U1E52_05180 [Geminicoccaceae bacterium]